MDLHGKIMNLEAVVPARLLPEYTEAYKVGHRDARHQAAELALKDKAEQAERDAAPLAGCSLFQKTVLRLLVRLYWIGVNRPTKHQMSDIKLALQVRVDLGDMTREEADGVIDSFRGRAIEAEPHPRDNFLN